jgi:hypothetical protein
VILGPHSRPTVITGPASLVKQTSRSSMSSTSPIALAIVVRSASLQKMPLRSGIWRPCAQVCSQSISQSTVCELFQPQLPHKPPPQPLLPFLSWCMERSKRRACSLVLLTTGLHDSFKGGGETTEGACSERAMEKFPASPQRNSSTLFPASSTDKRVGRIEDGRKGNGRTSSKRKENSSAEADFSRANILAWRCRLSTSSPIHQPCFR